MTQITAKITIRKDTAANWTAANILLADGEFAKESDTGKLKLGNGVTAWNSLAYFSSGGGTQPFLSVLGNYKISTNTTPPASSGSIKYSNATQINSSNLYVSTLTDANMDIQIVISLLTIGTVLLIQDSNDAANYQKWQISSTPTFASSSYTIPVTFLSSGGVGTTNFSNNHEVFFSAFAAGAAGITWGGITGTLSNQTDLQSALNAKQDTIAYTTENVANKDIDGTLTLNSDTKYPSQKAVKTYVDAGLSTKQNSLGFTPENVTNKDIDGTLAANSDTKYASQKATKTYTDAAKASAISTANGYTDTGLAGKQNTLGFTAEDSANKDVDGTLAANSDIKYASQKATKTYVDTGLAAKQNSLGFTAENVANKDIDGTLATNSDTKYPSQKAVKTYVDTGLSAKQNSLGYTAEDVANKDTDVALTANSDTKYASQKAIKSYVDTGLSAKQNSLGFTAENVANKDTDITLAANSDTKYPSQKAIKSYVDTGLSGKQNTLGFTPEDVSNKDIDGTLTANSDTKYPSQKAVKTYADTKRGLTPRVTSTTTATTLTINCDTTDEAVLTALASALTIANPTGTALDGQKLFIAIKDNGTIRTITLGANIIDVFGQVPASTTASKWVYIGLRYNTSAAAWHVLAANTQA